MAEWSQSHLLQSLGWATLNSFWQMALLWCGYLAYCHFLKPSASQRYRFSVGALSAGFAWFVCTFLFFLNDLPGTTLALLDRTIGKGHPGLQWVLTAASWTYLLLLAVPSWRLIRNWRFVRRIRRQGLQKSPLVHRLYIDRIAPQLGIRKKVGVFFSDLVHSPLTVGYLKPVILLPVAAMNHMSPQQLEAILLHELSHIRRSDYLVNLILTIINTVLYFNPFVRLFLHEAETERETCCDELVLHYGYDRGSYAAALLSLEQSTRTAQPLALAAAGKSPLLLRIEKIVGLEPKKKTSLRQVTGLLAALFLIIAFNSVVILRKEKRSGRQDFAFTHFINPFYALSASAEETPPPTPEEPARPAGAEALVLDDTQPLEPMEQHPEIVGYDEYMVSEDSQPAPLSIVQVAQDDIEASLNQAQKTQVKAALESTKAILHGQWAEVEKAIGEVMTEKEKALAQQDYLREVESVNWQNLEKNLQAEYEKINWQQINQSLNEAKVHLQIDSIQRAYNETLSELNKFSQLNQANELTALPLPDASVEDLIKVKMEIQCRIDSIKAAKAKRKIIKL